MADTHFNRPIPMRGDRRPTPEEPPIAQALLDAVLQTTTDGILVVDASGKIVQHNARFREIWRIPAAIMATGDDEQALASVLNQLTEPEQFLEKVKELYQDPTATSFDELAFKDGRLFERWSKPCAMDGTSAGRVWIFRDVTEKKNLQTEVEQRARIDKDLQASYKFVNAVVENIPNMIFVKDAADLRFLRFNKAGEDLLGYSQNELLGKNDYDFFPKSEADFFTSRDRAVLASKDVLDISEEPIQTRHLGPRLLHTKKIPIYDDQGNPAYLLGISEDITERKAAQVLGEKLVKEQVFRKESEKAVQMRNEFISIAAHELRTPLTSLKMHIQFLQSLLDKPGAQVPPQAATMLQKADDQIDRLAKRVSLLLDISRIRADRLNLEKECTDMGALVRLVAGRLEPDAAAAGSTIKLALEPSLEGNWDPSRLEQVIENLLSNAIKYGAGRPIVISAAKREGMTTLSVRDHGAGIPATDHERIFDRFERAVSTRTFAGLGLGLWITKQIVLAHGGQVRLASDLGKGSTFTIVLP